MSLPARRASTRSPGISRRHIQIGLGLLWLLDAALQFQPYMFSRAFPQEVIADTAAGQPGWVSSGVLWAAHLMALAPALTNSLFAIVQLLIAVAILYRPLARFGLAASIGWAAAVWYFGEGLGGIASGHASLITGAPGAVLMYALLAAVAWPRGASWRRRGEANIPVARVTIAVWLLFWVGGATLQLLPGQNTAGTITDAITGSADAAPGWLTGADQSVGRFVGHAGTASVITLVVIMLLIGTIPLFRGCTVRAVRVAGTAGTLIAAAFWIFGQSLGGLSTGTATDVNTGPLIALFAVALLSAAAPTVRSHPDANVQVSTASPHAGRIAA